MNPESLERKILVQRIYLPTYTMIPKRNL